MACEPSFSENEVLGAATRLGVAFMTNGTLIGLIAERRSSDPAAAEAAMRELEQRQRKEDGA